MWESRGALAGGRGRAADGIEDIRDTLQEEADDTGH